MLTFKSWWCNRLPACALTSELSVFLHWVCDLFNQDHLHCCQVFSGVLSVCRASWNYESRVNSLLMGSLMNMNVNIPLQFNKLVCSVTSARSYLPFHSLVWSIRTDLRSTRIEVRHGRKAMCFDQKWTSSKIKHTSVLDYIEVKINREKNTKQFKQISASTPSPSTPRCVPMSAEGSNEKNVISYRWYQTLKRIMPDRWLSIYEIYNLAVLFSHRGAKASGPSTRDGAVGRMVRS